MEVDKRVKKICIYTDGKSKEIQEKLFQLGAFWVEKGTVVSNEAAPFIYVEDNGTMWCGDDIIQFDTLRTEGGYSEKYVDVLLFLETYTDKPKLTFKQDVLVRNDEKSEWRYTIFSHIDKTELYPYICIDDTYRYCIPLEGNEHLLGTKNNPK